MSGISVVIPHYGDPAPTLALVGMLREQRTALPLQVIVSDDCSPTPFPDTDGVVVTRRCANGGFGSAVNAGAALAEHDYLLVLNSDLEVGETFVDDLVSGAQPWMPAMVSPWVESPTGHPAWTGRHFPLPRHQFVEWLTPLARWRDRRLLHEAVGHDTRVRPGVSTAVDWVVGAALLVPLAEFRAVGGFDERFFMNSEEVDLQRRLRERGIPSIALAGPVALHAGGGSSDPMCRRSWLVASRLEYATKWGYRRRLELALRVATSINFVWNCGRRALRRPSRPLATARNELNLLSRRDRP